MRDSTQIRKSKFLEITETKKEIDYRLIEIARKKAEVKGLEIANTLLNRLQTKKQNLL
ncbi:hypothetical protein AGMMS50233_03410 [Endomicrobiia bacterium]|nr:hypothetical protein AGMMS50233_03410 [Endomicrobiia bacterium]